MWCRFLDAERGEGPLRQSVSLSDGETLGLPPFDVQKRWKRIEKIIIKKTWKKNKGVADKASAVSGLESRFFCHFNLSTLISDQWWGGAFHCHAIFYHAPAICWGVAESDLSAFLSKPTKCHGFILVVWHIVAFPVVEKPTVCIFCPKDHQTNFTSQ